jgi:hypothetical protein
VGRLGTGVIDGGIGLAGRHGVGILQILRGQGEA